VTADELRAFEREVADAWEAGKIRGPCHLAGGNEEDLVAIFKEIQREDWVFSTWRSSYHALLHGVPRELVMADILAGKSMFLHYPERHFFTSSIVGGVLPIASGVAAALKDYSAPMRVWCFVGDMCATTGAFHDALQYAEGHDLPITFVNEDNGVSTNTPTQEVWGDEVTNKYRVYNYERTYPHVGSGVFVPF
jgi:TPP-dependent pyruvate/acetoin dehydrogenase alpha subunit